ncbi:MAG: hypothetical protein NW224_17810 [Leptolyngbyaceae cyanobacterium bins.302]|nr:hypothetical protein [Leptolyngbyaceae cyanobacterium bins.302]
MDLFDRHFQEVTEAKALLVSRMRPRTLDEFVGQEAIVVGKGAIAPKLYSNE